MFKLNTARTYKYPVHVVVYDEAGNEQKGSFTATFKVLAENRRALPENESRSLLDMVLVGAEGIEVAGADGAPLQGAPLLEALKNDPATHMALSAAYNESWVKKNRGKT